MERDQEGLLRAYMHPRLKDARACPFCGSTNLCISSGPKELCFRRKTKRILCAKCCAQGPIGLSEEHAVIVWNGDFTRSMNPHNELNPPRPDAHS